MDLGAIFRVSRLLRYGLLAVAAGVGLAGYGLLHQPPAETDLQTVTGKVERGTKVTTRRRRGGESVSYKFEVKDDKGTMIDLTLPSSEISERQALVVLNANRITAKYDAENDVYAIAADGRTIIDYATTRQRREGSDAFLVQAGIAASGLGLLLALTGFLWNRRKV